MDRPLCFDPFLRPMVWGGRGLADTLSKPLPDDRPYGESWEVSDHPLHRSICRTAPWTGATLRTLMEKHAHDLLGRSATHHSTFPWLIKFLDAHDWLSVQVHPDEEWVRRLWPGEGPKTEVWFVIAAHAGSRIYAGLMPGVDEQVLRRALAAGTVAECLPYFTPKAGDCLFLPSGSVHAVGGGVLMAELQQTSDATFRLFDWNRRDANGVMRPLHVEEGLASIHWNQGRMAPKHVAQFRSKSTPSGESRVELVRCPYFHLDYWEQRQPFSCGGTERMQAIIVLEGSARIEAAGSVQQARQGEVWVLPASMPAARALPAGVCKMLLGTLP